MKEKADLTSVAVIFYIIIIVFEITINFLLFSLIVVHGILFQSIRVQTTPSTGMYSQKAKTPVYGILWYFQTKNF